MSERSFVRKHKEDRPVLAICYDFDKTLTPDDMQAQGFIQSVGYDVKDFWTESNSMAQENEMDNNLAYMYQMIEKSEGEHIFNKKMLADYGSKVTLFPGVNDWFERTRNYGLEHGVIVEHYIISSGLKEMIEGTEIAKKHVFEKIYASSFYFNEKGVAKWPAQVVNYTNKTQFLFRIEKGVLDVNDQGVNDYFPPEEIRVPFRNMVYIGDSDTDIPCMKLVNTYGGHAVGVYDPNTQDKKKVYKMMGDNRIRYFVPADYSLGSELDSLLKRIIERTAANEVLEKLHVDQKNEIKTLFTDKYSINVEDEKSKEDLILALEDSGSFANTHEIIKNMKDISNWTDEQKRSLFRIGVNNSQVRMILCDMDVRSFYKSLLENLSFYDSNVDTIKREID